MLAITLSAPAAEGAPEIIVRGHCLLRVVGLAAKPDHAVLTGELADKELLTGVSGRALTVTVESGQGEELLQARAVTDDKGRFQVRVPLGAASYRVRAQFLGDTTFAPTAMPSTPYDLTKPTPTLLLSMDSEVAVDAPTVALTVRAELEGALVALPVRLHKAQRGSETQKLRTPIDRTAGPTLLPTAWLGGPGPVTLVATFAGNAQLNPASALVRTEVVSPTTVTLGLRDNRATVRADESFTLVGTAGDYARPLAAADIRLESGGQVIARGPTDAAGRFRFTIDAADFSAGRHLIIASHLPDVAFRKPGRSAPLFVEILAPEPVPAAVYAISVGATLALLLILAVIHALPWVRQLRLSARTRATRRRAGQPAPGAAPSSPEPSGVILATPQRRSRAVRSFDISGQIDDPTDHVGVAAALIRAVDEHGVERSVVSDGTGAFAHCELAAGPYRISVHKLGYVSERFVASIPHRGTLSGLAVNLVQVRVRVLELYQSAVELHLPQSGAWARWTPREILHRLTQRRSQRHPELSRLTVLVEDCYWSGSLPDEDVLADAEALQSTCHQELGDPQSGISLARSETH